MDLVNDLLMAASFDSQKLMIGNRLPDFLLHSHCYEGLSFDSFEIIGGDQCFILREDDAGFLHYQTCTILSASDEVSDLLVLVILECLR